MVPPFTSPTTRHKPLLHFGGEADLLGWLRSKLKHFVCLEVKNHPEFLSCKGRLLMNNRV